MAEQVESLTKLLKQHNVGISAVAANKIMLAAGVLEVRTRPSSADPTGRYRFPHTDARVKCGSRGR